MNENMGQIIKRLRKERNLTQEELAEQLNISAQAISKWENGTSMPDISQVVPLANLFGVPTDVLFGIYGTDHNDEVKARLDEIYRICDNCKDGEEGTTAMVVLEKYRDAMRMYPNNTNILTEAMAFAEMVISCNRAELAELIGEKGLDDLTQEIIHWAELVIKYGSSFNDTLSAKRRLLDIYVRQEKRKDAEKIADEFPRNITDIRGILVAELKRKANEKQEERTWRCFNIEALAKAFGHEIAMLGNWYKNEERYEDALYCYSFLRDMVESLYRKEKYRPPFVFDHYPLYGYPAYCLMKLGKTDEAISMLEDGAEFIQAQAESFNKKKKLDIPLLRDCSFCYGYDGDADYNDLSGKLYCFVCNKDFKPLQNDHRYKALVEKITADR